MIEMLCNGLSGTGGGQVYSYSINSSLNMVALPFYAESLDPITEVYIYADVISGTAPVHRVSLQELDAGGSPSGTILGGGSPASATFDPAALGWANDTLYSVALDNSYTPTHIGQYLVAVIEYYSGTINTSNRLTLTSHHAKGVIPEKFPYITSSNGGSSWSIQTSYTGMGAYKTASASYGFLALDTTVRSFSSSSSPNEYAVKFTVPSRYASYKIRGVWIPIGSLSGDFTTTLYSGGDATDKTALHSIASDEDWFVFSNGTACVFFGGPDDSANSTLQTLTAGNTYRIAVKADTTTSLSLRKWEFPSSALRAAVCFQEATQLSTRSGTGDWTDDDTIVMPFAFILEDVAAGGGGGSSFTGIRAASRGLRA